MLLRVWQSFLKIFVCRCRLPGEAQQISRILECFAARFFECNPNFLVDADACFLLAYSTVLLNVGLHNPSVRVYANVSILSFDEPFFLT